MGGRRVSKPVRTFTAIHEAHMKRAHELFLGLGPAFDRPKEISNGILCLANICDVLIRAIETQQMQIAQLQDQVESLEDRIKSGGRR
jgi:hypothetical protein